MATRIISELVVSAQLMDILECPICLRVPPKSTQIYQCANGHLFCAECYKSLENCSICRIPFHMHIRCIMAEKAISILNSAEQSLESNNNEPAQKIQQPQLRQKQPQQHVTCQRPPQLLTKKGPKKVTVTFKNDVMNQHRGRNGTYILQTDSAKVNGKDFWIQDREDDKNAIWFNKEAKMWQLGKLESIGRNCCFIHAACNASELHKVTSWKYTKCGDWVFAPTNDLQVRGRIVENATGRVLRYNQTKLFGFIQRQGTDEEYFVHESSTQSTDPLLCSGLNVRFDIDICDKGYEATNVKVV